MAEDGVKHPRERQAENSANEERREDGFFLPLDGERRTRDKVDSNSCECN